MSDEFFSQKNTGFWGAIAASCWLGVAYFRFLAVKASKKNDGLNVEAEIKKEENMSEQKKGIQNLKEVVDFGLELKKAGKDILGGGLHPEKLGELLPVYEKAIPAFKDIGEVVPELKDLDEAESAELIAFVVSKGGVDDKAIAIASEAIQIGIHVHKAFELIKS